MEQSRAMDFVRGMVGKSVNVSLKDGTEYKGKLNAFDIHTNIVLENCEEMRKGKKRKLNIVFISGSKLESCTIE